MSVDVSRASECSAGWAMGVEASECFGAFCRGPDSAGRGMLVDGLDDRRDGGK